MVLGTASDNVRAQESLKLLNFGFQFYDAVQLYAANQAVSALKVWKGAEPTVKAGFTSDFILAGTQGFHPKIQTELVSQQPPLIAPVALGQVVGTMKVKQGRQAPWRLPVVAAEAVGQGWHHRPRDRRRAAVVHDFGCACAVTAVLREAADDGYHLLSQRRLPAAFRSAGSRRFDRGFLFGDGAYEVIPVHSRSPFRIGEHLKPAAADAGWHLACPTRTRPMNGPSVSNASSPPHRSRTSRFTCDAWRRHQARPRLPLKGVPPTVFIFTVAAGDDPDAVRYRCRCHYRARQPLAALRSQGHAPARQCRCPARQN